MKKVILACLAGCVVSGCEGKVSTVLSADAAVPAVVTSVEPKAVADAAPATAEAPAASASGSVSASVVAVPATPVDGGKK